jgi:hypothetical protein
LDNGNNTIKGFLKKMCNTLKSKKQQIIEDIKPLLVSQTNNNNIYMILKMLMLRNSYLQYILIKDHCTALNISFDKILFLSLI